MANAPGNETDHQQFAGVDFAPSGNRPTAWRKGCEAARQIGDAGMGRGVTQHFLHEQGQQHGAAVEHESQRHHQRGADGEAAVAEDAEIHYRMAPSVPE